MYQLFNLPLTTNIGSTIDPNWNSIRNDLKRNLATAMDYYRGQNLNYPITGLLISIINAIGTGHELSDRDYYLWVVRQTLPVSQNLGITSSASAGKIHKNQFYGPGIREVLMSYSESFDYDQAAINWRTLQPVTVLSHPISDTSIPILTGINPTDATGYAVISINIPLLMVQYRSFRAFESQFQEQGLAATNFVHRFVLPSMFASHLDYSLFNRFYNHYFDKPQTKGEYKHPIYFTNRNARVDSIYGDIVRYAKSSNLSFNRFLKSVPLAHEDTLLTLSRLPDFYRNRNVNWALTLARLDLLELLLANNRNNKGDQNRTAVNSIQRHAMLYQNDQLFNMMLPRDQAREVNAKLTTLLKY